MNKLKRRDEFPFKNQTGNTVVVGTEPLKIAGTIIRRIAIPMVKLQYLRVLAVSTLGAFSSRFNGCMVPSEVPLPRAMRAATLLRTVLGTSSENEWDRKRGAARDAGDSRLLILNLPHRAARHRAKIMLRNLGSALLHCRPALSAIDRKTLTLAENLPQGAPVGRTANHGAKACTCATRPLAKLFVTPPACTHRSLPGFRRPQVARPASVTTKLSIVGGLLEGSAAGCAF